ncbi:Sulfotransferase [Ectocarpus siliculosus]|uniref:Sulfotransferase n=1 Tax=Ectocarpus siliculosus TaxID=2880 RepID=D7FI84_ECTSI|nr:Sulfotransferase [Ectocarpus siliculosus]|eukprot:CBJ28709.1 Sulfotransferase [Ectocarpus siliculosus]
MPPEFTAEEMEELSRERAYLNGLVEETAEATGQQACNLAFAKTHKTASTTMAMILVRYARRHDMKLASFGGNHVSAIPLTEAVQQIEESGERVDVMHYHYTAYGSFDGRWAEAKAMYEKIMREGERINYITVVRSQRSHFLSYYYYYVQPEVQLSVQHFFGSNRQDPQFQYQRRRLTNPLCAEFGIHNGEQLAQFIETELPDFRLVLLTEAFDEGLMMMRRILGWEMIDMTYSRMMETKAGGARWDGKELKNVPHWEDLPTWVQDRVDANTALDKMLYDAAVSHYNKMKAVAAMEIEDDLKEFDELQKTVNGYLALNSSSEAIRWYSGSAQPYLGGEQFHPF